MVKVLFILLMINWLSAATEIDETNVIVRRAHSPERLLTPERGCVLTEHFAFLFQRLAFAEAMAPAYADPNVMKYINAGETLTIDQVKKRFSSRAEVLFNDQNLRSYYWVVVTRSEGICGVFTAFDIGIEGALEVSFLLSTSVQKRRLTKRFLEVAAHYLSGKSWKATAHPDNEPSWRALESAGFVCQKTEFVERYGAYRKFYIRPSNEQLENMEIIRFTYSGKRVLLAELCCK